MKKIVIILKKNATIFSLVLLAAIIGMGVYWNKKMGSDITGIEDEIKKKYSEVKKYEIDKENAPSPELIRKLTEEKNDLNDIFEVLLIKFSTSYPTPPEYKLYPSIEFKEFLYFTQDYLYKKARKRKVTIPSYFGFQEGGLRSSSEIPVLSLKLDVVKRLIELIIDSGVTRVDNITPGVPKSVAFYKDLPVQVTLTGTSVEIVRFLKYLENPSSFFILQSFSLSRGESGLFTADMGIKAIMLKLPQEKESMEKKEIQKG